MPITWCYDVENNQKYCSRGFPIGCYVTKEGKRKDACVISVSCKILSLGHICCPASLHTFKCACRLKNPVIIYWQFHFVYNMKDVYYILSWTEFWGVHIIHECILYTILYGISLVHSFWWKKYEMYELSIA